MFVVLNMAPEVKRERVLLRHKGDQQAVEMLMVINYMIFGNENKTSKYFQSFDALCEAAGDDEENAVNVMVTRDMTREEVVALILQAVQ